MDRIERKAYGKINLGLDVLGRREDGYHLLKMVMQTVDIADTVVIEKMSAATGTDPIEIIVLAEPGNAKKAEMVSRQVPAGSDNLIYKAAARMMEAYSLKDPIRITLTKRIPIAAGMAGGSTDAAAVFLGLRDLFGLSAADRELQELALPLGADIPYCIEGGTKLSEGIGEILTPLPTPPECGLVIVKPDLFVQTGWVYKTLDGLDAPKHPDVDGLVCAIRAQDLEQMAAFCGNILECVTAPEYPVIKELEQFLLDRGALQAKMTGSGPTVFGIYRDLQEAETALEALGKVPEFAALEQFAVRMIG